MLCRPYKKTFRKFECLAFRNEIIVPDVRDCNLPVGYIGFSLVVVELKELVKEITVIESIKKDNNKNTIVASF